MKKTAIAILIGTMLVGCNMHTDLMPFLGKWIGKFQVSTVNGAGSEKDRAREELKGFVQIYATNRSYKMELEGEQETIKIDGTWTISGKRITLTPKKLVIDDKGGADQRDPNKKYIAAEDVRAAYGQPLVLTESANKKALHGMEITVGSLVGHHEFVKDSF